MNAYCVDIPQIYRAPNAMLLILGRQHTFIISYRSMFIASTYFRIILTSVQSSYFFLFFKVPLLFQLYRAHALVPKEHIVLLRIYLDNHTSETKQPMTPYKLGCNLTQSCAMPFLHFLSEHTHTHTHTVLIIIGDTNSWPARTHTKHQ